MHGHVPAGRAEGEGQRPHRPTQYAGAAAAGDDASYLPIPGAGHIEMIDPAGRGWATAATCLADWL
jgi:hypothetical protein